MFIPRQPVVDNQFCEYGSQTGDTTGVGGTLAHAGAAVYMDGSAIDPYVYVFSDSLPASGQRHVFGLLMQKVKTGYHEVHPAGWVKRTDFGSSDAIAQPTYDASGNIDGSQPVPVGVAHCGGIWDTTHYESRTAVDTWAAVNAGDLLNVTYNSDGRLTNFGTQGTDDWSVHGEALVPMFAAFDETGTASDHAVGLVIKGVSAAKAESTFSGQTMYPIRFKLLV
jgi:hypothetical protein